MLDKRNCDGPAKMRIGVALVSIFLFGVLSAQSYVIVLGTAQDGGFPHIGCKNECQLVFKDPELRRHVVSLALVDPKVKKWWLFEATPDMDEQLQLFSELTNNEFDYLPEGIFISHAHIGHYTGLISLGREALGSSGVKVYALPRLEEFLRTNGPWSQLVSLNNIDLVSIVPNELVQLNNSISVTPFTVPHRDEFSETAGFTINTKEKSYLFIPDIDKWSRWKRNIVDEVGSVDYAFLDGSFFEDGELPNRSMAEVPHPFVLETMALFEKESLDVRNKLNFIHFNHTNPLLFDMDTKSQVLEKGFRLAVQGEKYE